MNFFKKRESSSPDRSQKRSRRIDDDDETNDCYEQEEQISQLKDQIFRLKEEIDSLKQSNILPTDDSVQIAEKLAADKVQAAKLIETLAEAPAPNTDEMKCITKMLDHLTNKPWFGLDDLNELENTFNTFTSNIKVFSELESEIRALMSKLQTIDWITLLEEEKENILNLYAGLELFFSQYQTYRRLTDTLIQTIQNSPNISEQEYKMHVNKVKDYHPRFQEAVCRVGFNLVKVDPTVEFKGLVDFISKDYCPNVYSRFDTYRQEQNKGILARTTRLAREFYHRKFSLIGIFKRIMSSLWRVLGWLRGFQTKYYIAFTFTRYLVVATSAVGGLSTALTAIMGNTNPFINLLFIFSLAGCRSLMNPYMRGAILEFLTRMMLMFNPLAILTKSFADGIGKVLNHGIRAGGDLMVLPQCIQNIFSGLLSCICTVIQNLSLVKEYTISIIIKGILTVFPKPISVSISYVLDLYNGTEKIGDITTRLHEGYTWISVNSPETFNYFGEAFKEWLFAFGGKLFNGLLTFFGKQYFGKAYGAVGSALGSIGSLFVWKSADDHLVTEEGTQKLVKQAEQDTNESITMLARFASYVPPFEQIQNQACELIKGQASILIFGTIDAVKGLIACDDIEKASDLFDLILYNINMIINLVYGILGVSVPIFRIVIEGGKRVVRVFKTEAPKDVCDILSNNIFEELEQTSRDIIQYSKAGKQTSKYENNDVVKKGFQYDLMDLSSMTA
jgi:hypothetical protein